MVLQQCLACNTLITGLTRSCACGHVLGDATRYIGGKRYSEYRATLYSRLESQKKRKEARESKKQKTNQQQTCGEPKDQMSVISDRTNFKPVKRRTLVKRTSGKKNMRKSSYALKQHRTTVKTVTVPPELLSRFPSALQEINRRIIGQNIMWLALQLE
ncbi:uncharacterized protein LOC144644338 [Oculina patagonica]